MDKETIVAELERILEKTENLADQCARQILKIDEAMEFTKGLKQEVISILPDDTPAYRTFDRMSREATQWWDNTLSGYVAPKDCSHIEKWIDVLKNTINELEPEFLRDEKRCRKQYFFCDGEEYQAKKAIFKIMKRAAKSLVIVDTYLDDTIFDYIESLDSSVNVQILTGNRIAIFKKLFKHYVETHPNTEGRELSDCHDRFLIIDGDEVWHLGASINHAGKKAFMLNKVIDENEKNTFLSSFSNWWSKGVSIA